MSLPDEDQIVVLNADTSNLKTGSDRGVVLPSFTTTERDAVSTTKDGAILFNSTSEEPNFFFDGEWRAFIERPLQDTVGTTPFAVTTEDILLVDPGVPGSDIEIDLPTSASRFDSNLNQARPLTIRNIHDSNVDRVNINPDGSEEINEVAVIQLKRGESVTITPDGSDWWSVST